MLQQMGGKIEGAGTSTLTVHGVEALQPTDHRVIGDRIVGATWAFAAAMTRGDVTVRGVDPHHLDLVLEKLRTAGAEVTILDEQAFRVVQHDRPEAVDFVTLPYPGFATDLQPFAIALTAVADGTSMITENLFEARFRFIEEMVRLGADARTDGHHAVVRGVERLSSAPVGRPTSAPAPASCWPACAPTGVTEVWDVFHIDRGYPRLRGEPAPPSAAASTGWSRRRCADASSAELRAMTRSSLQGVQHQAGVVRVAGERQQRPAVLAMTDRHPHLLAGQLADEHVGGLAGRQPRRSSSRPRSPFSSGSAPCGPRPNVQRSSPAMKIMSEIAIRISPIDPIMCLSSGPDHPDRSCG